jgi:hypothetical protein
MASIRQRIAEMPDPVHTVCVALAVAALYFAMAAILEKAGVVARLPLAPKPLLGLAASVVNLALVFGLYRAVSWVRPLVAAVPLFLYPLEYGLGLPRLLSLQAAEFVAVLVLIPAAVLYLLYHEKSVRQWFSPPNTSLERTRER